MTELKFGAYLRELLTRRGLKPIQLAKAIEIHESLVYRWLKKDKPPALNAPYVRKIAEVLNLEQNERFLLEQAQIRSLKGPEAAFAMEAGSGSFSSGWMGHTGEVYGAKRMIEVAIDLIAHLPPPPEEAASNDPHLTFQQWQEQQQHSKEQSPGAILLTFQGQDAFSKFKDLHDRWHEACYKAMQRGWQVHHLWKLDSPKDGHGAPTTHERGLHLVKDSLKALGTAHYFPRYFKRPERLSPPYDLLILPRQKQALWFFACESPDFVDAALSFQQAPVIERLRGHFSQLASQTFPLFKGYWLHKSQREREDFWNALEEAERQSGASRLLVKKTGLSTLTRPTSWYAEGTPWAREAQSYGPQYYRWIRRYYDHRLKAFQDKITTDDYMEICSRKTVTELVRTHIYQRDNVLGRNYQASREEVGAHLQNIITLLEKHDKYQLALLDAEEEANLLPDLFWEVIGDESVWMQAWSKDAKGADVELGMKITERTIVKAFQEHFLTIWEDDDSIVPAHKDKSQVIQWLRHRIEDLG